MKPSDPLAYADAAGRLPVMLEPVLTSGVLVFYAPAVNDGDGPERVVGDDLHGSWRVIAMGLHGRAYDIVGQGRGDDTRAQLTVFDPATGPGTLQGAGRDAWAMLTSRAIQYEYDHRSTPERGEPTDSVIAGLLGDLDSDLTTLQDLETS